MAQITAENSVAGTSYALPQSVAAVEPSGSRRVTSVDLLRGIVMILMALDHTRDYFSNLRFPPEDLVQGNPLLYATRWVTHFCAPTFFLLAGVGAALALSGGKPTREVSRFLLTRGIWLIVLEVTLTHIGWQFSLGFPQFLLVIWALGLSMVVLSGLVFLPKKVIAVIAVMFIFGHNLLDGIDPKSFGSFEPLWHILHVPGLVVSNPDYIVFVGYPLIPWFAVMALGFVLGDVFTWKAAARKRFLVRAGLAVIVGFIVLRYLNSYGNPVPWSVQRSPAMTVASFLNLLKYPPSLLYLLMTLGPAFVALALFENVRGRVAQMVSIYGRVPMFYYVLHLFLIHALAVALALWQGGKAGFLGLDLSIYPTWYGTSLPGVYLAWAVVIVVLYLPCRWFAGVKARRKDWWLGYM